MWAISFCIFYLLKYSHTIFSHCHISIKFKSPIQRFIHLNSLNLKKANSNPPDIQYSFINKNVVSFNLIRMSLMYRSVSKCYGSRFQKLVKFKTGRLYVNECWEFIEMTPRISLYISDFIVSLNVPAVSLLRSYWLEMANKMLVYEIVLCFCFHI